MKDGKCFGINSLYFQKKYTDESNAGKFDYSIKIRNLKEEVKDDNVESGISGDEGEEWLDTV